MQGSWSRSGRHLVGLLAMSLALTGCAQSARADGPGVAVAAAATKRVAIAIPVEALAIFDDEIEWAGIRIGTPRVVLERTLGKSFDPLEANELCSSFISTREVDGHEVTFEFAGDGPQAPLEHLFLPLDGSMPQAEQIRRLKARLPASVYVPSRFDPDRAEDSNPKPVYRVATTPARVVMLGHDEGLWIGDPRCYD